MNNQDLEDMGLSEQERVIYWENIAVDKVVQSVNAKVTPVIPQIEIPVIPPANKPKRTILQFIQEKLRKIV